MNNNGLMEDGCMIRKQPAEHGREVLSKLKSLVTANAYLSATFGPNIFHLCHHWVSIVRE